MACSIQFIFRHPIPGFYSIEELFQEYARSLSPDFSTECRTLPYPGTGFWNRCLNLWITWRHRPPGPGLTHITGDVHYLALVLPVRSTLLTIHDCTILQQTRGWRRWLIWFFWFYLPVRRLCYITVVSEETKRSLLEWVSVNPRKIHVIPNGLIGDFHPKTTPFQSELPTILVVGTTPNKNLYRVIEALKIIPCQLCILGELQPAQELALQNARLSYTQKTGLNRAEVARVYSSCDFLLYPSLQEGFGLPILEAQASGIPVITSNLSAMPATAGSGACFVDPYEVVEIQKAVVKVIRDAAYREGLVREGLENLKRFSLGEILKQYEQLYLEMLPSFSLPNH